MLSDSIQGTKPLRNLLGKCQLASCHGSEIQNSKHKLSKPCLRANIHRHVVGLKCTWIIQRFENSTLSNSVLHSRFLTALNFSSCDEAGNQSLENRSFRAAQILLHKRRLKEKWSEPESWIISNHTIFMSLRKT